MKTEKDITTLMIENASLQEEVNLRDEEIKLKDEEIKLKDEKIKSLQLQLLYAQRQVFGRRSEKQLPRYDEAWPTLFSHLEGDDALEEEKQAVVTIVEEVEEEAKKRRTTTDKEKKHITRTYKLPDNLRREDCVLEPEGVDLNSMVKSNEAVI